MNRLRLFDVRESIARVLNTVESDSRVVSLANEAHRRLVSKGNWLGAVTRYRVCTTAAGCLTWPRQISTILVYWRCDNSGTIRNGWYESSLTGPGLQDSEDAMSNTLIDRGTSCTFDVITGTASKVKVTADVAEDPGARILIRGYTPTGTWIRTQDAGVWIEGEYVTISTVPQYTVNLFGPITEVIKPVTNGPVRLWEYDTTLTVVTRALAYYEADEELPIYRCSLIPGLGNVHGCGNSDGTCTSNVLTVVAKLRHIDVRVDNDFFLLGNLGALKLMVMAIMKEERNLFDESAAYESKAIRELQMELNSFEGDGAVPTVKQESPQTWGASVLNPLTLGYRIY